MLKRYVDQLRYQPIIEIDKNPNQSKSNIIENQLDKLSSMLSIEHVKLSFFSQFEDQQGPSDICIQNCIQHSKNNIFHLIEADTAPRTQQR